MSGTISASTAPAGIGCAPLQHGAEDEIARAELDRLWARGRALLEEDLRSPCTEEIAVFRAFAQTVAEGAHRLSLIHI